MAFRTTVSHADIEVASLMTQLAKHMQIQVAQMHFLEARLRLQTHPQLNWRLHISQHDHKTFSTNPRNVQILNSEAWLDCSLNAAILGHKTEPSKESPLHAVGTPVSYLSFENPMCPLNQISGYDNVTFEKHAPNVPHSLWYSQPYYLESWPSSASADQMISLPTFCSQPRPEYLSWHSGPLRIVVPVEPSLLCSKNWFSLVLAKQKVVSHLQKSSSMLKI